LLLPLACNDFSVQLRPLDSKVPMPRQRGKTASRFTLHLPPLLQIPYHAGTTGTWDVRKRVMDGSLRPEIPADCPPVAAELMRRSWRCERSACVCECWDYPNATDI